MILKRGIPFLTLIWVRGHIMLYIGSQARPRPGFSQHVGAQEEGLARQGRKKRCGPCCITTLRPGRRTHQRRIPRQRAPEPGRGNDAAAKEPPVRAFRHPLTIFGQASAARPMRIEMWPPS